MGLKRVWEKNKEHEGICSQQLHRQFRAEHCLLPARATLETNVNNSCAPPCAMKTDGYDRVKLLKKTSVSATV